MLVESKPERASQLLESGRMTEITMPRWLPLFFMAEGALVAFAVPGYLSPWGSRIAMMTALAGGFWYAWYRNRQLMQPDSQ
jgi:hypothetical protein